MNKLSRKLLAFTFLLGGCTFLQPQPDPSRFFVLMPTTDTASGLSTKPAIGLGPIEFPAYLQRAQIVTRVGPNEITLSEFHRWGEQLERNFARVLAVNVSNLLKTDEVIAFPWFNNAKLDITVPISVLRFETDKEGTARLRARWQVVDPNSGEVRDTGESDVSVAAADGTPDAAVAALSETIEQLAEEIARAVTEALGP